MARVACVKRHPMIRRCCMRLRVPARGRLPLFTHAVGGGLGKCERVRGPQALLSSLPRDPELQALGAPLPRWSRTIGKILRHQGCILDEPTRRRKPLSPREPLEEMHWDGHPMHPPSQLTRKLTRSRWWRSSPWWMLDPPSCFRLRSTRTSLPKPPSRRSCRSFDSMACLPC